MSSALSAVLQGLERGSGMGLNMYKALNDESRANRQEQFQRQRAARQDMEWDKTYERTLERDKVADNQWQSGHDNAVRRLDLDEQELENLRTYREGTLRIQSRQQDLADKKFVAERGDKSVERSRQFVASWVAANELDEEGRYRTDQELAEIAAQQGMTSALGMAGSVGLGVISPDRALGYESYTSVPVNAQGDVAIAVTGTDGQGRPIQGGPKPLTQRGTSDPDDEPIVGNFPAALAMFRSPASQQALGKQGQSDTLIDMDTQDSIDAENQRFGREMQSAEADVQAAEQQIAKAQAELETLEQNRPESLALLESMPMSNSQRRALERHPEVTAWNEKRAALSDVIANNQASIQTRRGDLEANRARSEQKVQGALSQAQRDSVAYPQNYRDQKDKGLVERRKAVAAAKETNHKTVAQATKDANAYLKETLGSKNPRLAEQLLDVNKVAAELEQLGPEEQAMLAQNPGGLKLMVSAMAENGMTSFGFLMDALNNGAKPEDYYEAVMDPAAAEAVGRNKDQLHELAKAWAQHKSQHPDAPREASLLALSQGKKPPTKAGASLGRALYDGWKATTPAAQILLRD